MVQTRQAVIPGYRNAIHHSCLATLVSTVVSNEKRVKMATDAESSGGENQEEQLQDLTDEQLEKLLHETLLVTGIIVVLS